MYFARDNYGTVELVEKISNGISKYNLNGNLLFERSESKFIGTKFSIEKMYNDEGLLINQKNINSVLNMGNSTTVPNESIIKYDYENKILNKESTYDSGGNIQHSIEYYYDKYESPPKSHFFQNSFELVQRPLVGTAG